MVFANLPSLPETDDATPDFAMRLPFAGPASAREEMRGEFQDAGAVQAGEVSRMKTGERRISGIKVTATDQTRWCGRCKSYTTVMKSVPIRILGKDSISLFCGNPDCGAHLACYRIKNQLEGK